LNNELDNETKVKLYKCDKMLEEGTKKNIKQMIQFFYLYCIIRMSGLIIIYLINAIMQLELINIFYLSNILYFTLV
jgi:hypothetical protein